MICVWDRRIGSRFITPTVGAVTPLDAGQAGPALEFKNVVAPKSSIWSLRFSRTKRGCLAALANTGHLKTYDIAKEYMADEMRSSVDETLGHGSARNYPEQIYTKYERDIVGPFNHPSRGYAEEDRVVAFDFLNMSSGNEPSAITMNGTGQISILTSKPPSPPVRLSSQGSLIWGSSDDDSDFKVISPPSNPETGIAEIVRDVRDRVSVQTGAPEHESESPLSSRKGRERAISLGTAGDPLAVEDALTLLSVSRLRCKEGYLFDEARNRKILADDPWLQGFWDWIERMFYAARRYCRPANLTRCAVCLFQ